MDSEACFAGHWWVGKHFVVEEAQNTSVSRHHMVEIPAADIVACSELKSQEGSLLESLALNEYYSNPYQFAEDLHLGHWAIHFGFPIGSFRQSFPYYPLHWKHWLAELGMCVLGPNQGGQHC